VCKGNATWPLHDTSKKATCTGTGRLAAIAPPATPTFDLFVPSPLQLHLGHFTAFSALSRCHRGHLRGEIIIVERNAHTNRWEAKDILVRSRRVDRGSQGGASSVTLRSKQQPLLSFSLATRPHHQSRTHLLFTRRPSKAAIGPLGQGSVSARYIAWYRTGESSSVSNVSSSSF
jgi:hypothetical protein